MPITAWRCYAGHEVAPIWRSVTTGADVLATYSMLIDSRLVRCLRDGKQRSIRGVPEDPLECPRCKGPMRVIALIDDPDVVRRILEHLGHWAPEPAERGPPAQAPDWPRNAAIPLALPRSSRHRVAQRERQVQPHLPFAPSDDPMPLRIRAILT